ncbi:MAG: C39 family peptidase [Deltaproteobacteria bacterium]|nr:C39 family peptidase [Deltaproteobacteria bacterium]
MTARPLKMLLALTVLGLLTQGCATPVGVLYREAFDKRSLEQKDIDSEETYILEVPQVKQAADNCCGLAALAMVVHYWREKPESIEFVKEHQCPPEGFTGQELVRIAVSQGFKALVYKGSLPDLFKHLSATRPVIVILQRYGGLHYVVVVGHSQEGGLIVNDPAKGQIIYEIGYFMESWKKAKYFSMMVVPRS